MINLMDLHTHTVVSGHAYNTIYEMAASAAKKGVALLGISDHGPNMMGACEAIYFSNFKVLPRELYGVKMLFGCELNILDRDGNVDLPECVLAKLDYTIASLHTVCYAPTTREDHTRAYLKAMENPYVNIIGHPDDNAFPVDYEALVRGAKENHVLLEVNCNSLHPRCVRTGGRENYRILLNLCKKYAAPIIVNSDAHCELDICRSQAAYALLEEVGFPEELVVNRSLDAAAEYIPFLRRMLDGKLSNTEASL